MLLVFKYLVPKGYTAITIYPFIVLKHKRQKDDMILINHEKIHLRQQLELLVLPFFIWYGIEFLIRLVQFKNWSRAYRNISFEREAYENEKDLDYLKGRSFWSFFKYV
ncbi:hypothetical protein [Mesoflavibacter sp. SCSIO 43206]|uniref:hypothetical protein n=1 Tax=Mesoflavibacter sp. SCSIO 43206 TaxID=2779362 RepID=UPI001CAA2457|nr:hypothetical protein [Mesoflavibacter sp. SCSIO 43206]UAB75933.1 hypothetical protein INR78_02810 [Mesoflavibacter sp. SCSIO 43206]